MCLCLCVFMVMCLCDCRLSWQFVGGFTCSDPSSHLLCLCSSVCFFLFQHAQTTARDPTQSRTQLCPTKSVCVCVWVRIRFKWQQQALIITITVMIKLRLAYWDCLFMLRDWCHGRRDVPVTGLITNMCVVCVCVCLCVWGSLWFRSQKHQKKI